MIFCAWREPFPGHLGAPGPRVSSQEGSQHLGGLGRCLWKQLLRLLNQPIDGGSMAMGVPYFRKPPYENIRKYNTIAIAAMTQ